MRIPCFLYNSAACAISSLETETLESPIRSINLAEFIEAGADDVIVAEDGSIEVLTSAEQYVTVKQGMTEAGFEPEESELLMRSELNTELNIEDAEKVLRLVDLLESSDDVQEVYYNADIPEEAYEHL